MYRREKSCHAEGWDSCGPATIPTILNRDFFKGLPWCVRICSLFVSLTFVVLENASFLTFYC